MFFLFTDELTSPIEKAKFLEAITALPNFFCVVIAGTKLGHFLKNQRHSSMLCPSSKEKRQEFYLL